MKTNIGFAGFAAACVCAVVSLPGHAASGTVDIVLSAKSNAYQVEMGEATIAASGGSGDCRYRMDDVPGEWKVTTEKCEWLYSFSYR